MNKSKQITVVGAGYVGMSLAALLSEDHQVTILEVDNKKVSLINSNISTVEDIDIELFLSTKSLNLHATTDTKSAFSKSEIILIAIPTNFDSSIDQFNTEGIEQIIDEIHQYNQSNALIVIKSTVPIGFTDSMQKKHKSDQIIFSPEFLREGHALHDNLYPSRILLGSDSNQAKEFAAILGNLSQQPNTPIIFMSSGEAEAVKLFSNTYLAMRVAYFNELDNYAMSHDLDTKNIIEGVSCDPRIGKYYNNPSFGYGGYCLPKDARQLRSNYKNIPQNLIQAIIESNDARKDFIINSIALLKPEIIGIYRLAMKHGSDNFRSASIIDVMKGLNSRGFKVIIYEPNITDERYLDLEVSKDITNFKIKADIIVANRIDDQLEDVKDKIFSRDIYTTDQ